MIFGSRVSRPTHWLKTGLTHARRVGRVDIKTENRSGVVGSGFLVEGGLLGQAFKGLPIFLTARHVISPGFNGSADVTILFEAMLEDLSPRVTAKCHHVLIVSPQGLELRASFT